MTGRRPGDRILPAPARLAVCLTVASAAIATAQPESVADTVHNLSVSGPGEIRALDETEVCKFCHVPHNAEAATPLWGHALSQAQYQTPELRASGDVPVPAPQPDGSSRLCLSCHDGTVALGDVAGEAGGIRMRGAERLRPGHRGFLGTDLTGSHPISFVLQDSPGDRIAADTDMDLHPLSLITADPQVRLDPEGKMQCTTCHDAHSDAHYQSGRVPRFWVKPTYAGVCLTCHTVR